MNAARSLLFVPGDRPNRFDKAIPAGADCAILDLEDAVSPADKHGARRAVKAWLNEGNRAALPLNPAETEFYADDLALASHPNLTAVLLPLIETPAGLLRATEIAAVEGATRLLFGSVDFMTECGITDDSRGLFHARSVLVLASAAAGLGGPVDGVTLALDDEGLLAADCAAARGIGMGGKLCIHPRQVASVNASFSPTEAEIEQARRVIAAAEDAGAKGAIRLGGRLVEIPVVERARRLLERPGG